MTLECLHWYGTLLSIDRPDVALWILLVWIERKEPLGWYLDICVWLIRDDRLLQVWGQCSTLLDGRDEVIRQLTTIDNNYLVGCSVTVERHLGWHLRGHNPGGGGRTSTGRVNNSGSRPLCNFWCGRGLILVHWWSGEPPESLQIQGSRSRCRFRADDGAGCRSAVRNFHIFFVHHVLIHFFF